MKSEILALALIGSFGLTAQGQRQPLYLLNPSDSFTFQLSPSLFPEPVFFQTPIVPGGELFVQVQNGSFQLGDSLLIEMFEGTSADAPFHSQLVTIASIPNTFNVYASGPGQWQDLQGAIRFTAVSGSFGIDGFTVNVLTPSPPLAAGYHLVVVPEPSISTLTGICCLTLFVLATFRKRGAHIT